MAQFDMPLEEMRAYRPDLAPPADLERFWSATLAEARAHDLAATFTAVDTGLTAIDTYDVTFAGFGGSPVRAGSTCRRSAATACPPSSSTSGTAAAAGWPTSGILWAAAGYAHLVMDTRGQGSTWAVGDTPDPDATGAPPIPGSMTQGILDPATYYYRRVYTDAVRAVEAVRARTRRSTRRGSR